MNEPDECVRPHLEGGGCVGVRSGCCPEPREAPERCDTGAGPCEPLDDTGVLVMVEGGGVGGPSCAHVAVPPTWPLCLALLGALLRRGLWGALLLCVPHVAGAVDLVRQENLDGAPVPGLVDPSLAEPWTMRAALGGTTALDPVRLRIDDRSEQVVEQLDTLELGGSLQVSDWFVIGLSVPVHRLTLSGGSPQRPSTDGVVFLRVPMAERAGRSGAVEVRLDAPLRRGARPLELPDVGPGSEILALFGDTRLTSGTSASLAWVSAVHSDHWWLGGRLGVRLQRIEILPGLGWGSRWEGVVGVRRNLRSFGLGASVRGSSPLLLVTPTGQWPVEALGTASWALLDGAELQLGGGAGLSRGLGAPSARAVAALNLKAEVSDQDGDGYVDLRDACPKQAEDRDRFRDWDGCPEPDNDQDGLVDPDDDCPNEPEVLNGWLDDDGCPDDLAHWTVVLESSQPIEQVSWSLDGIDGGVGLQPTLVSHLSPGPHAVRVEVPGHRTETRAVELDEGPTTTTVRLVPVRLGQVHVVLLSDDDGSVVDGGRIELDEEQHDVPGSGLTLELAGGRHLVRVEAPGHLPRVATIAVPVRRLGAAVIRLEPVAPLVKRPPVLFEHDSDRLTVSGIELVDALAVWLTDHREVQLLRVDGHADEVGGSRYNLDLSQRRAEAVVAALGERGIDRARLEAVGSGETRAWLSLHAPPPGVDAVVAGQAVREVRFQVLVWDDVLASADSGGLPF